MSNQTTQNASRAFIGIAGMLICTSACLFAATAKAEPTNLSAPSLTVSLADLDLSTAQGQRALERRLTRAAKQVCASDGFYSAFESVARRQCVRGTLAAALASVKRAVDAAVDG